MIRLPLVPLALAALLGAGAAACNAYTSPREKLQDATLAYHNGVRWQRYEIAARALPPERRQAWVQAMERLARSVHILDFELVPIEVGDERAIVEVDIAYTRAAAMVVERMRRRQSWTYVEGAWRLTGEEEVALPVPDEDEAPATWPEFATAPTAAASP